MPVFFRYIIITAILSLIPVVIYSQGLKIKGNDHFIDERTSFSVFDTKRPVFSEKLDISFEMAVPFSSSIGYVLRIKNEKTGYIYNLLVNDQGESMLFKFSNEGYRVKIEATPDPKKIKEQRWIKILMSFDLKKDSLMLQINDDKYYTGNLNLEDKWQPLIYFGRSDYVIDVPTFIMKNLEISDSKQRYFFPLNESKGELVHNDRKEVTGYVSNPVWMINDAYHWKHEHSYSSQLVSGTNFNSDTQEIYYFNKDSIVFYNIRTGDTYAQRYLNKCPLTMRLGTNFLDKGRNELYVYEVSDLPAGNVSIAYLDLNTFKWKMQSAQLLPQQLHHHCGYYDEENRRYIIYGGFGNLKYNKSFYSYDLEKDEWSTLSFEGDTIMPRYFTSMGYDEEKRCLYVFGGMGNDSGDQTAGRRYFYDLYKIDLDVNRITKLWEIPWKEENFVPVRSLLVAEDNTFYTLCYPEHFSKSELKLYQFSIADGDFKILGDSIPICSEKITTNANLYFNANFKELFDIQQEFEDDDIASTTKVYSLLYPPVTLSELNMYMTAKADGRIVILEVILAITVLLAVFFLIAVCRIKKKKYKKEEIVSSEESGSKELPYQRKPEEKTIPNSIYLFGEFSVCDRHNRNVTYLFSTKLKQAFLLILQYTPTHGGISSQQFSDTLWPDKQSEKDKIKNLRGVTLNHLRKILKELDGVSLIHENGMFRLVLSESCYCDYIRLAELISTMDIESDWKKMTEIISRGKFLDSFDQPMFDSFKNMIERQIDPILSAKMKDEFVLENYFLTIILAESLLNIDPINEEALNYLIWSLIKTGNEERAKKQYARFISEYRIMMDENYPKTFSDLC